MLSSESLLETAAKEYQITNNFLPKIKELAYFHSQCRHETYSINWQMHYRMDSTMCTREPTHE